MSRPGPKGKYESGTQLVSRSARPAAGDWSAAVLEGWDLFWSSPAAEVVSEKDFPALLRLFALRDEYERFHDVGMLEPLVEGSTGQLVLNPALKRCEWIAGEVRQLEDRFGMNPKRGVDLGLKVAKGRQVAEGFGRV